MHASQTRLQLLPRHSAFLRQHERDNRESSQRRKPIRLEPATRRRTAYEFRQPGHRHIQAPATHRPQNLQRDEELFREQRQRLSPIRTITRILRRKRRWPVRIRRRIYRSRIRQYHRPASVG